MQRCSCSFATCSKTTEEKMVLGKKARSRMLLFDEELGHSVLRSSWTSQSQTSKLNQSHPKLRAQRNGKLPQKDWAGCSWRWPWQGLWCWTERFLLKSRPVNEMKSWILCYEAGMVGVWAWGGREEGKESLWVHLHCLKAKHPATVHALPCRCLAPHDMHYFQYISSRSHKWK